MALSVCFLSPGSYLRERGSALVEKGQSEEKEGLREGEFGAKWSLPVALVSMASPSGPQPCCREPVSPPTTGLLTRASPIWPRPDAEVAGRGGGETGDVLEHGQLALC